MSASIEDRFWSKVVRAPGGCWSWSGAKNSDGYGSFRIDGKTVGAHRIAYELACGEMGSGVSVCHRCDNPACCRPSHLFLGTHQDNMRDCADKGRNPGPAIAAKLRSTKAHCKNGHARTAENVRVRSEKGWLECRLCRRDFDARRYRQRAGRCV